MNQLTGLKLLRVLTGRTLAALGKELGGYRRAHMSQVERDPSEAGPKLRKKLTALYGGSPWSFLSAVHDASKIATAVIAQVKKEAR
jgi:hypothetical protein